MKNIFKKRGENLIFNEKEHKYSIGDKNLISVTQYIKSKCKPFEGNYEKYISAGEYGKNIHYLIEKNLCNIGQSCKIDNSIVQIAIKYLEKKEYKPIYSEEKIFNNELAGTFDLICEDKEGKYILIDWKTSKKIYYSSNIKMKEPYQEYDDCNYNHFLLQLNLYKKILEENYEIKIDKLIVIQLTENKIYEYNLRKI